MKETGAEAKIEKIRSLRRKNEKGQRNAMDKICKCGGEVRSDAKKKESEG